MTRLDAMRKFLPLVVVVAHLASAPAVLAQEWKDMNSYSKGREAYKKSECAVAIEKLSRFRALNEDKLASHKLFSSQIDQAIKACETLLDLRREVSQAKGSAALQGKIPFSELPELK